MAHPQHYNSVGAAPAAPTYRRREPERTPLYQAVQASWLEVVAQCDASDSPLPDFVTREVEGYLRCGILAHGFARVRCKDCGYDRFVAFSCKGRAWCPSCGGRFMADTAARLMDHVLPPVPYRQWVLTVPLPLRYLIAYNASLCSAVLACFWESIRVFLIHSAERELGTDAAGAIVQPGAITAIQRAGGALNLTPHFHSVATDGVYVQTTPEAPPEFHALHAPTSAEIAGVAWDTCQRTMQVLRKRGLWLDNDPADDPLALADRSLAALAAASVRGTLAMGPRAGRRQVTFRGVAATDGGRAPQTQTPGYGFNLHAKRRVAAADTKGRERLLRYVLRPPIANERLTHLPGERVSLELKRPWRDGTTHVVFTFAELMQRLVALVFPPGFNRVRYQGVFAPRSRMRAMVVAKQTEPDGSLDEAGEADPPCAHATRRRIEWAKLLKRVFEIDVLQCPKCASRMQRIAFITRADAIRAMLDSVGLPADSPQLRRPPMQMSLV